MSHHLALIRQWDDFKALPFPRANWSEDASGADIGDLVELDSLIAGYASRVVGGERLRRADIDLMQSAVAAVAGLAPRVRGQVANYVQALASLGSRTIAASCA